MSTVQSTDIGNRLMAGGRGLMELRVAFWAALPVYLYAFAGLYIDDTYINLAYVKTLLESGVWGMHAQITSNAATSPLNVLLLAAVTLMTQDPEISVLIVTLATAVVIFLSLRYFSRLIFDGPLFAYGATALLFANPVLISTLGLESYLTIALILAATVAYHRQQVYRLGLLTGLLILARPDGLIVAAVFGILLLVKRPLATLAYAGVALATAASWHLYAWFHLGSFLPDTFFIKLSETRWGDLSFTNGPAVYLDRYSLETLVALAPFVLLLFLPAIMARNKPAALLGACLLAAAILQTVAYAVAGVPPFHWYYAWAVASAAILGPLAVTYVIRNRWISTSAVAAIAAAGVLSSLHAAIDSQEMPINSNWASAAEYREIAEWINDHHDGMQFDVLGEMGVIQYFTNANAINEFTNRAWLTQHTQNLDQKLWLDRMMALNFRHIAFTEINPSHYGLLYRCDSADGVVKEWTVDGRWHKPVTYCLVKAGL